MKNKCLSIITAMAMIVSMAGCGGNSESSASGDVQSQSSSQQQSDSSSVSESSEVYEGNYYDVNELYQAIMAEQPQDIEPLAMFDESGNTELISGNYPNFYNCDYEQILYYAPPISGYPCEIMIVQTKTEREADYIEEEFLDRIERGAADEAYPENAEGWVTRAEVQRDGNFVVMIVLPDGYEIPYVFGLA